MFCKVIFRKFRILQSCKFVKKASVAALLCLDALAGEGSTTSTATLHQFVYVSMKG